MIDIPEINDMFYRKTTSCYGNHTRSSNYMYLICTFFFLKHTKRHVLESTQCLELVIPRPYPESTGYSLSSNHDSEGKQIYSWAFDSEFIIAECSGLDWNYSLDWSRERLRFTEKSITYIDVCVYVSDNSWCGVSTSQDHIWYETSILIGTHKCQCPSTIQSTDFPEFGLLKID